jgi:PKD repeat protein
VYYLAGTSGWTNTYGGMPAVALNGLTFNATPTNGVAPLAVAFTAASSDSAGNAITHWQWQFGDGSSSTAQNPTHVYAPGAYYPQLLGSNSLGQLVMGSTPVVINVLPAPGLGMVSVVGGNLTFSVSNTIPGTVYRLLASANLALPFSQWTPAASNISSTTGNVTITLTNSVRVNVPSQFYILQSP